MSARASTERSSDELPWLGAGLHRLTEIVEPRVVGKCGSNEQGLPGTAVQVMDAYGRPDVGAEDPFASPLMFS